jgi:uncharacterized iron-regulated membrane protein
MTRNFWLLFHRWAGLGMAAFLVLVGLTGSVLAFRRHVDALINPHLYDRGTVQMNAADLGERAEKLAPLARVESVSFGHPGDAAEVTLYPRMHPATGEPYALPFDQVLLDPGTGDELARRTYAAISEGRINLMPFIYEVHEELVPGWGRPGWTILGIVALVWTIDCFVGLYLTFPIRRASTQTFSILKWCSHWSPAWRVKRGASSYRLNLDLHRASGLWLWAVLLVFAWTGVYMGLWDSVYTWATRSVMDLHVEWTELPTRPSPLDEPRIDWRDGVTIGERLMDEQARAHGFRVDRAGSFALDRDLGVYRYEVHSDLDIREDGRTRLYFDANSGALKLLELPTTQYAGNTVTSWVSALHMAAVFGLPYRMFVSGLGLGIVLLSATGVIVWWKKREGRLALATRRAPRFAASVAVTEPKPGYGSTG